MVHEGTGLWHATGFNASKWLMIIIHGYRVTTLVLYILLNVLVRTEYPVAVTAEIVDVNMNSLDGTTGKPLDVDLPPTLPMTFGTENSTSVLAQSGSTALMPCVVHNLGEGTVSWIKRKNAVLHELLTVGLTTYANDERFQAIHFHHSEDWTLQIKYVQPRDAGLYECQVSTHPPTSIFLLLEVVVMLLALMRSALGFCYAENDTRAYVKLTAIIRNDRDPLSQQSPGGGLRKRWAKGCQKIVQVNVRTRTHAPAIQNCNSFHRNRRPFTPGSPQIARKRLRITSRLSFAAARP
ncbi:uncharacterized protein LOC143902166 isoform X2 [Temnothorax americanus]|uniref:uncharacterized protein LOC143902166 isoform X2 n=1 Tax=Temnothorax americanus TaxID=1964332 RepID=UPI004067B3D8